LASVATLDGSPKSGERIAEWVSACGHPHMGRLDDGRFRFGVLSSFRDQHLFFDGQGTSGVVTTEVDGKTSKGEFAINLLGHEVHLTIMRLAPIEGEAPRHV